MYVAMILTQSLEWNYPWIEMFRVKVSGYRRCIYISILQFQTELFSSTDPTPSDVCKALYAAITLCKSMVQQL